MQNSTKFLNGKDRNLKEEAIIRLIKKKEKEYKSSESKKEKMQLSEKIDILIKLLNNISRNFF